MANREISKNYSNILREQQLLRLMYYYHLVCSLIVWSYIQKICLLFFLLLFTYYQQHYCHFHHYLLNLFNNYTNWPNGWVFIYELSGCGLESGCCHLNFRYGACFEQSSCLEFLAIQETIECRLTLKLVRDMIITYSQIFLCYKIIAAIL